MSSYQKQVQEALTVYSGFVVMLGVAGFLFAFVGDLAAFRQWDSFAFMAQLCMWVSVVGLVLFCTMIVIVFVCLVRVLVRKSAFEHLTPQHNCRPRGNENEN